MARAAAVVVFLALALLVATAASATPECYNDNHEWGGLPHRTGCSPDQNDSCNDWCQASCRGGECKFHNGRHVCHCYC